MKKQTFLFYFLSYSFLGCVKADRFQNNQETNYSQTANLINYNNRALFNAGKIQLEEQKFNRSGKGEWQGVDRFDFWLSVCNLTDRASQGILTGQEFYIRSELGQNTLTGGEKGNLKFKVTDSNCLRWKQEVSVFDYFAKSVNLIIHYEIESVSGNMGKIVRRIGINPWDFFRDSSRFSGFIDLTSFDKKDWPLGQWVTKKEDILSALNGDLFKPETTLQLRSLRVEPKQREQQPQKPTKKNNPDSLVAENLKGLLSKDDEKKFREEFDRRIVGDPGEGPSGNNVVGGINMVITLSAQPFVRLRDSTGVPKDHDLLTGKFMVFANLIASGASGNNKKYLLSSDVYSVTGQDKSFAWNLNENGLQVNIPLVLKYQSSFGRVELLIKIIPRGSDLKNIKPFTAVYDLGQWNEWVRNQAPLFKEESYDILRDIDYRGYLRDLNIADPELIKTLRPADDFIFGAFAIRFVRIMPGETATDRTLQYSVKTCIVSGLDGTPVGPGLQFDIETEDDYGGNQTDNRRIYKIRRATDNEGCLTWFGFLSHKYYRKEVLEKKTAVVSYRGGYKCDEGNKVICPVDERGHIDFKNRDFSYYMNPWDEKWTFGWDARDMLEGYFKEIKQQMKEAPDSKIFIPEVKYETMGFRYAVDKFLNLKVRKTVLLSLHPYVLKYNSIRLGRGATEKLRDGVYLMKVALQKDYLDPSARGVKIYDENLSQEEAENSSTDYENHIQDKILEETSKEELNNFTIYDLQKKGGMPEDSPQPESVGQSKPVAEDIEGNIIRFYRDGNKTYRVVNGIPSPRDETLKDSKKQFISIQQKLVRVIGGRIITPIEFEIKDLRLMRIRNQFFIQLETIDENKLKLATMFDTLLSRPEGEIKTALEKSFKEAYQWIDTHSGDFENEDVRKTLNKVLYLSDLSRQISHEEGEITKIREEIYSLFGLSADESEENKKLALQSFSKILHYKRSGLIVESAIENKKAETIDEIIKQHFSKKEGEYITDEISRRMSKIDELVREYSSSEERRIRDTINKRKNKSDDFRRDMEKDPWQVFMLGSHKDWRTELREALDFQMNNHNPDRETREFLERLKNDFENVDFTTSPLTPNFSLDLLSNAGIHPKYDNDGNPLPDDGSSGLPSRTFVGPMTFLLNHNSVHLRPTDVLNEKFCQTATCSVPDKVEQILYHQGMNQSFQTLRNRGSSVNESYERSNYYGFLGAYHNMTVNKLIEMKEEIDKKHTRQMELGSQPINFLRAMNLKYTSIYNEDESLGLKEIHREECESKELHEIQDCFSPLSPDSNILLDKEIFYKQLNDRYYSQNESDFFDLEQIRSSLQTLNPPMKEVINSASINLSCYDEELENISINPVKTVSQEDTTGWLFLSIIPWRQFKIQNFTI